MKVIGFTGNYSAGENDFPQSYLMTDSSILFTGRPFFVPDFAQHFVARPTIVVRTGRLGKSIAPKFASRYWDAFTAGFSVQACEDDDKRLGALDRAFDGAAIVGDWVSVSSVDNALTTDVTLMVNGEEYARCCLADMCHPLDELLAAVSTRCSIKMGDCLFTGDAGAAHELAPGDRLTANIAGQEVLDVKVRL